MARDPNTNQLLRKVAEKVEENNDILKKMHRASIWGRVFKIIYWVIILGIALGAYYFVQPYIENILSAYQSIISGAELIQ